MWRISGKLFSDNAPAVKIRHNTRPRYNCTFALCQGRGGVCHCPAEEKMRDRTHQTTILRLDYFSTRRRSMRGSRNLCPVLVAVTASPLSFFLLLPTSRPNYAGGCSAVLSTFWEPCPL